MVKYQSSSGISPNGVFRIADALLYRMSIPPNASAAADTQRRAPSAADRSTGASDSIVPPASVTSRAVSAAPASFTSQPYTEAPCAANSIAAGRPMPDPVLDLLAPGGRLAFICADRWMRNSYGRKLRRKILTGPYAMESVLTTHDAAAFEAEVSAYPAITVLRRAPQGSRTSDSARKTPRVSRRGARQARRASHFAGHQ
jgi:hypothetical protein